MATARISRSTIETVAQYLHLHDMRSVPDVVRAMKVEGIKISDTAARLAVNTLIAEGRARRVGLPGQQWFAFAVARAA